MKKNLKFLVVGVLIGALTVGVTAMADALWEKIDVVRNQITVKVNGETLSADNFLYNNTTYVPIRAVAEALGKDVNYADGVAYISDAYEVNFDGEETVVDGNYKATVGEINSYMAVERAKEENAGRSDEEIAQLAIAGIVEYNAIKELALENGIVLGEEFYQQYQNTIAFLEMQYGGKEGLDAAMKESGFSAQMYQRYVQTNYLSGKLMACDAFKPAFEEVKEYYEANQDQFGYEGVQAQHILIKTVDDSGKEIENKTQLKEKEDLANSIYKKANGGEDFDKLIEEYNEDPGMSVNPEGYVFTYGEMVPEFEEAAFALKEGEVSRPVKTSYGWHIIKKIKDIKAIPLDAALIDEISANLTAAKIQQALLTKIMAR